MIANRSSHRRTSLWLTGLLAMVVGGGLMALPAPALAQQRNDGVKVDLAARSDNPRDHKAEEAGAKKKTEEKHAPELPNIAFVISAFAKDTKIGKYLHNHGNWWVVRPVFSLFVTLVFLVIGIRIYRKRSIRPSRFQVLVEMIVESLDNMICGILGRQIGRRYLPFLGGMFIYILCLNLSGLIPLFMSPTAGHGFLSSGMLVPTCTTALALCTLVVTQYTSFRLNGVKGVLLHWCSSPTDAVTWIIGIIFIPLHVFSDLVVKPLSLLLRLFGNIYGEDVLLGSMLMLGIMMVQFLPNHGIPIGVPLQLPFMFLATLTSTIQSLVFTLLSTIYILMVLPHGDHDEDHEEAHAHA